MSIGTEYLSAVGAKFVEMKKTAEEAMEQLSEEDLLWSPNEASNSISIIVKHISGSMVSRWTDFFTTDGEKPTRNRDNEFVDDINTREQVLELWELGWNTFFSALAVIREEDLLRIVTIRNEPHSVIQAIERQMFHYSYHVGQIVYIAKYLKSNDWQALTIPRKK